jgi:hypothetical protein
MPWWWGYTETVSPRSPRLHRISTKSSLVRNDCFWRIVLKKSFLGDARNFLEPLTRFARGDVRDLIVSHKIDQGPSYRRHEALQR